MTTTPTTNDHPTDTRTEQPPPIPVGAEALTSGEWQHSLAAWLAAHKNYPDEARRRNAEGNVVLRLTVERAGHVLDVVLVRSSGSSLLDAAAEAGVRNATLPSFTAGMSQDRITVTIQIRYSLVN